MPISKDAFSGTAAWAALAPDEQAMFGAGLMEMLAAGWLTFDADEGNDAVLLRAVRHAEDTAKDGLIELFQETHVWQGVRDADGAWRVPSLIGAVCHGCGCSHEDPCEEGCGWASENLCTACATQEPDAGVEAAAVPDLDHAEAWAVVKGACKAVSTSELAQPVQPMGKDLRRLAAAIEGMHREIEGGGDA